MVVLFGTAFLPLGSPASAGLFCFWRPVPCAGIISGLAYTVKFLPPDSSSCIPQGVTIGDMGRVVVAYIERRPERMHEDFRKLAVEAWHEAWPCM